MKTKPTTVQVRLDEDQAAQLAELVEASGLDRSELMRAALALYSKEADRASASRLFDLQWIEEFGPVDESLVDEMAERYLS